MGKVVDFSLFDVMAEIDVARTATWRADAQAFTARPSSLLPDNTVGVPEQRYHSMQAGTYFI